MDSRIRKALEKADQGFTLIELLVVIIIIGILAAIAVPIFLRQKKQAVDARIKQDLQSMAKAQEIYLIDNPTAQGYAIGPITPGATVLVGPAGSTGTKYTSSPGDTTTVTLNTSNRGYCVTITNPDSTQGTNPYYYDSANGGLGVSGCS